MMLAFAVVLFGYLTLIFMSMFLYVPFVFAFQLIADRGLPGPQAVWTSWQAVKSNLGGVIWFVFVISVVSFLCMLMCYVPAILLMPISMGAFHLLYRDVFGPCPIPPIATDKTT